MTRYNPKTSWMRRLANAWLLGDPDYLLRSISRAITTSESLDQMLMAVTSAFREDADAASAHLFKISARRVDRRREARRARTEDDDTIVTFIRHRVSVT